MIIKLLKSALLTTSILGAVVACTPKAQNVPAAHTVELGSNNSAIIGGVQVAKEDAISKSTVAILVAVRDHQGNEGQFVCTGSLIAADVLVTAAHCLPGSEYKEAVIAIVFKRDLNTMDQFSMRPAVDGVVHPHYGEGNALGQDSHDIALIRFEGGIPAGYEIAKFLEDETLLKKGATVTLAGYGLNKTDGVKTENDNTLRKTDVQVLQSFGNYEMLLDQSKGKGACHGDSGGPAFIEVAGAQYVWGVTSRGAGKDGKDDCSLVAIYTKIGSEKAFIDAGLEYLAKNKLAQAAK